MRPALSGVTAVEGPTQYSRPRLRAVRVPDRLTECLIGLFLAVVKAGDWPSFSYDDFVVEDGPEQDEVLAVKRRRAAIDSGAEEQNRQLQPRTVHGAHSSIGTGRLSLRPAHSRSSAETRRHLSDEMQRLPQLAGGGRAVGTDPVRRASPWYLSWRRRTWSGNTQLPRTENADGESSVGDA